MEVLNINNNHLQEYQRTAGKFFKGFFLCWPRLTWLFFEFQIGTMFLIRAVKTASPSRRSRNDWKRNCGPRNTLTSPAARCCCLAACCRRSRRTSSRWPIRNCAAWGVAPCSSRSKARTTAGDLVPSNAIHPLHPLSNCISRSNNPRPDGTRFCPSF